LTPTLPLTKTTLNPKPAIETQDNLLTRQFAGEELPHAIRKELSLWFSALESFLQTEHHSFADGDHKHALSQNWANEVRIGRWALIRLTILVSQLSLRKDVHENAEVPGQGQQIADLYVALSEAFIVSDELANAKKVDFYAWAAWSKSIERELLQHGALRIISTGNSGDKINLPPQLESLTEHPDLKQLYGEEILQVISRLNTLLERLKIIGDWLETDEPLKPSLLLFSLIHDETRALIRFIEQRVLRFLPTGHDFFDLLDSTIYIISIELRKVFTRELVGVGATRSAPVVFASVETAHGLLQDCFQQSLVVIAQSFMPDLVGSQIFPNFQTRLEQSLILRNDLWRLLEVVKKAESSPVDVTFSRLQESVDEFRENSLRYLMYKDCEATERFIEEILHTRQTQELGHVIHRFGAYLETLLGQVNMRTVLANHPFEYSQAEK
jgi:hypothetical protein